MGVEKRIFWVIANMKVQIYTIGQTLWYYMFKIRIIPRKIPKQTKRNTKKRELLLLQTGVAEETHAKLERQ